MSRILLLATVSFLLAPAVLAQPDPPPSKRRAEVLKRFDKNNNGRLDSKERKAAMAWLKENRDKLPPVENRGPGGGPPPVDMFDNPGGPPPGGIFGSTGSGGGGRSRNVQDRVTRVADQFDANKDGKLDRPERDKARAHLAERGSGRGRGGSTGRGGRGRAARRLPGRGRGGRGGRGGGRGEEERAVVEPHQVT
ncbi:MAG: hypothetical protein HRU14_15080, partial [Planctomycetes bacterium]|nr:hypothetical protein [Planctomycetota bacterium]